MALDEGWVIIVGVNFIGFFLWRIGSFAWPESLTYVTSILFSFKSSIPLTFDCTLGLYLYMGWSTLIFHINILLVYIKKKKKSNAKQYKIFMALLLPFFKKEKNI